MERVQIVWAQLTAVQVVLAALIQTHPQKDQLAPIFEAGIEQITSILLASQQSDEFVARVREEMAPYIVVGLLGGFGGAEISPIDLIVQLLASNFALQQALDTRAMRRRDSALLAPALDDLVTHIQLLRHVRERAEFFDCDLNRVDHGFNWNLTIQEALYARRACVTRKTCIDARNACTYAWRHELP